MTRLEDWGWDADFEARFQPYKQTSRLPARVVEEQRDGYRLRTAAGEVPARVSGRLRHDAASKDAFPAVGDWVAVETHDGGPAVIHATVPRRTSLVRKEAGAVAAAQVIAANVDVVFLMASCNNDLVPARIERYLAAIFDSGAQPVLLLSKADLAADPETLAAELAPVALGVPLHVISVLQDAGIDAVEAHLAPRRTVALVGSSGVGKSTLLNRVAGEERQVVRTIRSSDERGCHTTTARRLLRLPSGALLLDTPGMRELALWDADDGLDTAFEDVTGLFAACRFRDCGHDTEPGCAVQGAIEEGTLAAERFEAWAKLQREIAFVQRKGNRSAAAAQRLANRRRAREIRSRVRIQRHLKGQDPDG